MTELLTAAQMRAIEQAAIASGEVTGLELMERAGRGVVEAVLEEWPEMAKAPQRAVVLCGPGNNGGDGFVVARLLKQRGWEVEVFLYGDAEKLPPDARVNYERWREMGEVQPPLDVSAPKTSWEWPHIIVDALFGTGLTRPLEGAVADLKELFDLLGDPGMTGGTRVVAVDSPSGLCMDSGRPLGELAFFADLTVSFHGHKCGHHLGFGPSQSGRISTVDIGLPPLGRLPLEIRRDFVMSSAFIQEVMNWSGLKKKDHGSRHKYSYGHAIVFSGAQGRTGASRLAARGALRIGAGLVTIASPSDACPEHAAQLNAIMLREVDEAKTLQVLLEDTRINALCIGPALGLDGKAEALVKATLASPPTPLRCGEGGETGHRPAPLRIGEGQGERYGAASCWMPMP